MGEIVREVQVCGFLPKKGRCATIRLRFDSGATMPVISRKTAKDVGAEIVHRGAKYGRERRRYPLAFVKMVPPGYANPDDERLYTVAVVSDRLAGKAAPGADGLIDRSFLQKANVALHFSDNARHEGARHTRRGALHGKPGEHRSRR